MAGATHILLLVGGDLVTQSCGVVGIQALFYGQRRSSESLAPYRHFQSFQPEQGFAIPPDCSGEKGAERVARR